ncbi:ABC transporter permease subunit [Nakamurella sp. YIM 132087]|uniref:ABC transporter permease subunit n=1 Tax=Nakamurella alba TaxID=2665158 RepID=A0A7K1FGX4_9ACTN|nr:carbohydrate ABC transporter permease [Nakamurella alba]MTD13362.1 ABC transporter permease subunit [Nakamurella alba]
MSATTVSELPVTTRRRKRPIGRWIGLTALFLVALFPIYWIVVSSVTPGGKLLTAPPRYLPTEFTFDNFVRLFTQYPVGKAMANSLIISITSTVVSVAISYLAAYAFARYSFPGSKLLLGLLLLSSSLPQIATVIPLFDVFGDLDLVDSLTGLNILITSAITPFTVWILTTFIRRVPVEVEEAAKIDGASMIGVIFRITLPLTMPAVATMLVINFIHCWNELFYPLIFAQSADSQPLALGLLNLSASVANAGKPWDLISALTVIMIAPIICVVIAFEPFITKGLAATDK